MPSVIGSQHDWRAAIAYARGMADQVSFIERAL